MLQLVLTSFAFFCSVSGPLPSIHVQNLRLCIFSRSRNIRVSQNLKSRSRDLGHASFWPIFYIFCLLFLKVNLHAKFEVCIFSRSRDIRGCQNLKVGTVTQAALSCDLILSFWISTSWFPVELQISTWLDLLFWRSCGSKILAFWLENVYLCLFLPVLGDFDPLKLWYRCSNPKISPRSQSRKEMWLTGEKYDWLATWSRLEKAKWLTDDLSQYDWRRRRRYDDFSQHRRRLQRSPGL